MNPCFVRKCCFFCDRIRWPASVQRGDETMKTSFSLWVWPLAVAGVLVACSGTGSGEPTADGGPFEPGQQQGTQRPATPSPESGVTPGTGTNSGSSGSSGTSGTSGTSGSSVAPTTHPECNAYESTCGSPSGSPHYARDLCETLFSLCASSGHSGTPAFIACGLANHCSNQVCGHLKNNCKG